MKQFLDTTVFQNHPLRLVQEFLKRDDALEKAKQYDQMRFVGYVLDIGFDTATIITSDPFKVNVGGIPRNSLLIMTPANIDNLVPHFILLRVLESAPTPLTKEVQQTYFELQKRSMPELDVFTQSELQWGALNTAILGMFYPNPEADIQNGKVQSRNPIEFSGDINNFVSAHKYRIYSPDETLLKLIVNSLVPNTNQFALGDLRLTETRMVLPGQELPKVPVLVSTKDFMGARTAMFGKTRLGKSNVVKLIAQSMIETTNEKQNVGQLIFDINGEYSNDNPQDDNRSLASAYTDRCEVYALTPKTSTPSKPLKLNFYEQPDSCHDILGRLLEQDGRNAGYVLSFTSVALPSFDEVNSLPEDEKSRPVRKLLIYLATLFRAGFKADEARLAKKIPRVPRADAFNPNFSTELRNKAYADAGYNVTPNHPKTLDELQTEFQVINQFRLNASNNELTLKTSSKKDIFDSDDMALLDFFDPKRGLSGYKYLNSYRKYHDPHADHVAENILNALDHGRTVILDLGNADEAIVKYFSDMLSKKIFNHQVNKFSNNALEDKYIQLYFEEAHNLFPLNIDPKDMYARLAKEGAKYHIGMVYSTQSPTTIYGDLLAQTENFFIAHLAAQDDVNRLAKLNIAFDSMKADILRAKTPGYMRMLTQSHRFVISVQAKRFIPLLADK